METHVQHGLGLNVQPSPSHLIFIHSPHIITPCLLLPFILHTTQSTMLRALPCVVHPTITSSSWKGQFIRLEGRSLHITTAFLVLTSLYLQSSAAKISKSLPSAFPQAFTYPSMPALAINHRISIIGRIFSMGRHRNPVKSIATYGCDSILIFRA
jgi:hypothetical protein